jgi:hypothetical protein
VICPYSIALFSIRIRKAFEVRISLNNLSLAPLSFTGYKFSGRTSTLNPSRKLFASKRAPLLANP